MANEMDKIREGVCEVSEMLEQACSRNNTDAEMLEEVMQAFIRLGHVLKKDDDGSTD